jgi:hypothetical protein
MRIVALPALAAALLLGPPAAAETVAHGVFEAGLLRDVREPAVFRYRYEMQGRSIERAYASKVRMEVREVAADGGKQVYFDMFEGPNRRQFGPVAAAEQNPLVIVFLQRDVTSMGNLTGGAAGYFQQQVREAFNAPAEAEATSIELAGRTLPATRLVIRPFANDPNIARFPKFKDKAYEFVVAEGVPGGIYRIAARTPDPADGHLILEESVTFEEVVP